MATAIALQASSAPAVTAAPLTSDHHSRLLRHHRMSATTSPSASSLSNSPSSSLSANTTPSTTLGLLSRGLRRDGVSCDACLFRKSRCALNELVNKCYSCEFHRQDCTFTLANSNLPVSGETPQTKKRKLDQVVEINPNKRLAKDLLPLSESSTTREMPRPSTSASTVASPKLSYPSSQHIGMTTELEPMLLEHLPLDNNEESLLSTSHRIRRFGEDGPFMRMMDNNSASEAQSISLDAIETMVAPYGSMLVDRFFQRVHPVFPVLMEEPFRHAYRTRKGLSPLLLASVYTLTLKYLDFETGSRTARKPDVSRVEAMAIRLVTESLPHADISTIQAGLLIMQRSSLNTSSLNGQLVTAAFELGLHQDCSNWNISRANKGLRKRMAWALYMQDKWSSLVHGQPSHMSAANWTVRDLTEEDFTDAFPSGKRDDGAASVGHGTLLFCQQVALTAILADILDTFYTLRAVEQFNATGNNRTRYILEKAKPVQIRLKEWFAQLPTDLKMDPSADSLILEDLTEEAACNGPLHVAYFATEITLHRCIVRSLSPDTADNYLSHICRSAAKTRLISAMDFVNRLRPGHLQSFWPAPSRTNFALIGSFGTLLLATAPTKEEAEFYRQRLSEYRWTLSVSAKTATFMKFAIDSLDLATDLAQNVPEKPGIEELMASSTMTSKLSAAARRPSSHHHHRHIAPGESQSLPLEIDTGATPAGAASSVISGLASPATSMEEEEMMSDEEDEETYPL